MPLEPPTLADVCAARTRIAGSALRTPLVRLRDGAALLGTGDAPALPEVWLKLENLQPIGSFKIRGAANAMALAGDSVIARGVWTASAGNMAQGVAWCARERGVPCRVVVPDHAPRGKLDAIERLGAQTIPVPFDGWWRTLEDRAYPGENGRFVHPFADRSVMAGNGTIGLEILEDVPDVDAVLVPWGGGGLACGIAAAVRAVSPHTKVYAVEVETAAPLTASLVAGRPVQVTRERTFIDGMGSDRVFDEMFALARELLAGTLVVSVAQVAAAVRVLADRAHVVAEGAGAAPLAAVFGGALNGVRGKTLGAARVACVVSGGNLDAAVLASILRGEVP